MRLIQMLVPLPADNPEATRVLADMRTELVRRFGGVTAYARAPARGVWTDDEGQQTQDDVVMVEVVTAEFDRAWWRQFADGVAGRLGQQAMHVRALKVEMLDQDGA